jgi:hypothetical protein
MSSSNSKLHHDRISKCKSDTPCRQAISSELLSSSSFLFPFATTTDSIQCKYTYSLYRPTRLLRKMSFFFRRHFSPRAAWRAMNPEFRLSAVGIIITTLMASFNFGVDMRQKSSPQPVQIIVVQQQQQPIREDGPSAHRVVEKAAGLK